MPFASLLLSLALVARGADPAPQGPAAPAPQSVRIGVLSHRGGAEVHRHWDATAEYLGREIPGRPFTIVPLDFHAIDEAVELGRVEFVLSNPADYIKFEERYGASRMLTLRSLRMGKVCTQFGAVIFVDARRSELKRVEDLKGRSFAAVSESSFGGWLMALRELKFRGIDPPRYFRSLAFKGTHDAVVLAVRDGTADAGTIRADLLAQMVAEGRASGSEFRILDERPTTSDYPFPTSTRLYPEWPLAAVPHTPPELVQKVAAALLRLRPEDAAAQAAGIAGWSPPLNYRAVHACLRELHQPPYDVDVPVTLTAAVQTFQHWVIAVIALILALLAAIAYVIRLNRSHSRLSRKLETQLAERERAERLLRESELFYHTLVETLHQNILRKDCDGHFTFVNRRFCETVGRPFEQIVSRTDHDLFPRELADKYRADDQRVMDSGIPIEIVERHVTPDGQNHYVSVIKTPLYDSASQVIGVQGIFWDVTELYRTQEELRKIRERFELAVRGSKDGLWDWDLSTSTVYFSPQWKSQLGFADEEIPDRFAEWETRLHPEDRERALAHIRAYLDGEITDYQQELRLRHRDGSYRWILTRGFALRNEAGKPYRMAGSHTDITGRKRVEEELRQSRERFELAVQGSKDGIWDWDLTTDDVYYSPRYKELLGFGEDELPDGLDTLVERLHPDDHERVMDAVIDHIRRHLPFDVETRMRVQDGTFRWFHIRAQAIWDDSDEATRMAGSLSDITERKQYEETLRDQNERLHQMALSERTAHEERKSAQVQMVESAKLAGLGQMVAGVAHEINNPLSFVSNNVAVLQRDLAEVAELVSLYRRTDDLICSAAPGLGDEVRSLCQRIDIDYTLGNLQGILLRTREGLRRIQQIVKDLRVFARVDEGELNEVDLNAGIDSTANIIRGYAKEKQVELELDLTPLPPVLCYAAKINQVVMNLVSNAIDASDDGSAVIVRSRPEADGVVIEVEDHGCGIAPEIRQRIFDPFFTTKPIGVGTGLGLSISYGIVQAHGGTIEVESTPYVATIFRVHLPLRVRPRIGNAAPTADGVLAHAEPKPEAVH